MSSALPQPLTPFRGALPADLANSAVDGLGAEGIGGRAIVDAGLVPPDVLVGMTLLLLTKQPRRPNPDGSKKNGAVAGGVWVREQVTCHAPVRIGQEVEITGESARRFVQRGRRYGVTTSETRDLGGRLLVSNRTTGLLTYRRDDALPDGGEGREEDEIPAPRPDPASAASNPAGDALARVQEGDAFASGPVLVTLAMMRARDAGRDDNPIHTDPEVAKREGLAAPIAGGSHVLSFLQELLHRAWGPEALLHGAHFDVQWKGQTRAETRIVPRATVLRAAPDLLEVDLRIEGEDRDAMIGTAWIPRSAPA